MLPQVRQYLSQPLMIDSTFAQWMMGLESAPSDTRGVFVSAPCPRQAAEAAATSAKSQPRGAKMVAVLPVYGVIDQHSSWAMDFFGGCSVDALSAAIDVCMNEDRISSVLLDVHSPGGSVYGVPEFANKLFNARSSKLICSVSNSLMASAAYYIGAAASRVYASPSSDTGSVGVYTMHADYSKMLDDAGIKYTIERVPEFKAEGNPYEPLPDQAKDFMRTDITRTYNQFVADLAKYRGMEVDAVKDTFGKGRCLDAASAAKCGMVNRAATFDDVLARMQSGSIRPASNSSASDDWDSPVQVTIDPSRVAQQEQRRRLLAVMEAACTHC